MRERVLHRLHASRRTGAAVLALVVFLATSALLGCGSSDLVEDHDGGARTIPVSEPPFKDHGDPSQIVERSIAAYGGEAAWEKLNACRVKSRLVVGIQAFVDEAGADSVIIEDRFQYPDRQRRSVVRERDGTEVLLSVVNGNTMWVRQPEKGVSERPVAGDEIARPAVLAILDRLMQMRASPPRLALLPVVNEGDRELVGITMTSDGGLRNDVYFDSSTWLVARDVKYYLPDMAALPKDVQTVPTGSVVHSHKAFDGVTIPARIEVSQRDKKVFDCELLEIEFVSGFSPETFAKPADAAPAKPGAAHSKE